MESDTHRSSLVLSVAASFEHTVNATAKERAGSVVLSARSSVVQSTSMSRDSSAHRVSSAAPSRARRSGRGTEDASGRAPQNKVHDVVSDPEDDMTTSWMSLNTSMDMGRSQERSPQGGAPRVFASTDTSLCVTSPTAPTTSSLGTSGASLRNPPTTPRAATAGPGAASTTPTTTTQRVAEARQRALESRKLDIANKAQQLEDSKLRVAEADERRALIGDQHVLQRSLCWAAAVWLAIAAKSISSAVAAIRTRRDAVKELRFFPHLIVRIRRPLRRARLRLCSTGSDCSLPQKPTVPQLRFDKMLNLFSDAHLQHCIDHLQLRYYFENERIIYMGSEDDEAYVLCQGTADVMMGTTCVFTMRAGMSFGTVGMISGEPRTASIVARTTPCLVWSYTRKTFDTYQSSSNDRRTLEQAHAIIAELRESNMRNVYKPILQPAFLRTFPMFKGVDDATLVALVTAGTPKVIKSGTTVYCPKTISLSTTQHLLLLRGTFRFSFASLEHRAAMLAPSTDNGYDPPSDQHDGHHGMSLTEQVMRFVELPLRHAVHEERTIVRLVAQIQENYSPIMTAEQRRGSLANHPLIAPPPLDAVGAVASTTHRLQRNSVFADATGQISDEASGTTATATAYTNSIYHRTRTDCFFMDLRGPLLLNIATIFLHEHHNTPFVVQALGDCDVMSVPKEVVLSQDVLELAVMRQNAYNLHCPFMPALPTSVLLRALFQTVSGGAGGPPSSGGGSSTSASSSADAALIKFLQSRMDNGLLPQNRWVYGKNDFVNFNASDDGGMAFLVVLAGRIDHKKVPTAKHPPDAPYPHSDSSGGGLGLHPNAAHYQLPPSFRVTTEVPPRDPHTAERTPSDHPFVWPSLPHIYFGCTDIVSRVQSTRLDVVKIQRSDLIKLLVRELDESMLSDLIARLAQAYVDECGGRRPTFSELDVEELCGSPQQQRNSGNDVKVGGPAVAFSHTRGGTNNSRGSAASKLRELNAAAIHRAVTSTLSSPTVSQQQQQQGLSFPVPTVPPQQRPASAAVSNDPSKKRIPQNSSARPSETSKVSSHNSATTSHRNEACGLMSIMDAPDFDSIDAIDAFGDGGGPLHLIAPSAPSGVSPTSANPRLRGSAQRGGMPTTTTTSAQRPGTGRTANRPVSHHSRSSTDRRDTPASTSVTARHRRPSASTSIPARANADRRGGDKKPHGPMDHGRSLPLHLSDFVRSSSPKRQGQATPPVVFSGSSSVSSSMAEEELLLHMRSLHSHAHPSRQSSSSLASSRGSSAASSLREHHSPVRHRVCRPDRRAEREARRQQLTGSPPSMAMRVVTTKEDHGQRRSDDVGVRGSSNRSSMASSHHPTSVSFNEDDAMFVMDDFETPSEFRSSASTPRGSSTSRRSSSSITAQHRRNIERMVQTRYEKIAEFVAMASSSDRE